MSDLDSSSMLGNHKRGRNVAFSWGSFLAVCTLGHLWNTFFLSVLEVKEQSFQITLSDAKQSVVSIFKCDKYFKALKKLHPRSRSLLVGIPYIFLDIFELSWLKAREYIVYLHLLKGQCRRFVTAIKKQFLKAC